MREYDKKGRYTTMVDIKKIALFAAGTLFGSAGFKLLSSSDAKKVYTQTTAAVLRMKDSTMETVSKVQEQAGGSTLVTGVTVARTDFLEAEPEAVTTFLYEHEESALAVTENLDEASQLVADLGIIEKAPVAKKAIPYCNITCLTGEEMKAALSGYLQVLYDQDPSSVGGNLPGEDFYYIP